MSYDIDVQRVGVYEASTGTMLTYARLHAMTADVSASHAALRRRAYSGLPKEEAVRDEEFVTMVSTQDNDLLDSDDNDDVQPVPIQIITHDQAMVHPLDLKDYILQNSGVHGMALCHQLDECCRQINRPASHSKKHVGTSTAFFER